MDGFARRIEYLRISLTDRCNYRCTYCMPEQGVDLLPRDQVLSFEEVEVLVRVFAGLGVRRIRLTGGEPTVRKNMVDLVRRVAAVPGIEEVVMTTNGHLLTDLAPALRAAGMAEVNVSIDTLDADRFRAITRRGDLARVRAGIDAALAAGMKVKLNAVVLGGFNDSAEELAGLCSFGWERGATPRFIEHMPMSEGSLYEIGRHVPAAAIRSRIGALLGEQVVADQAAARPVGPARYFRLDPSGRRFGIISAMSEHFCDTCNRLRLTSTGELHACLAWDDAYNLRDVLRSGQPDADIERDLRATIAAAVAGKREGHEFQIGGSGGPTKHMVAIGG
ncbi:MAG TPA: GTP 3',8-cyclase MoaA [Kofleriaceae bacterium]|nr:GTP 3',8-cyclase MoaA [Kofleriaceae bacterium]